MSLGQGNLLNNRYRIVETLGRGGMGAVYRAVDESLGVDVAVKENLFTTDDYARQFRMEAVIMASIRHPNLPRVTDHFVLDEQGQYLVMDFIDGDDLRQRLEKQGTLDEFEAIRIGAAVCDALTYLHTRKPPILHRDLKLGNVKLPSDGSIVLVDFGLAKQAWEHEETMTGARAMTPGYSPPEQYGSARTDARSDVYSLGATLYAAITGVIPEDSLMRAVDGVELTPLRKHKPSISPRLARVIEKAMETIPSNRYQSAEEFKAALLGVDKDTDVSEANEPASPPVASPSESKQEPESESAPPRRKKSGCFGLFVAVLLLTLTAVVLISLNPGNLPFVRSFVQTKVATLTSVALMPQATSTVVPQASATDSGVVVPATNIPPATHTLTSTHTASPAPTSPPTPTFAATEAVPTAVVVTPSVTPAGGSSEIAYAMSQNSISQIYLANTDGTNIRQLTSEGKGACNFDWSPDGQQLVYVSPCAGKESQYPLSGLRLLDMQTGNTRALLDSSQGDFDPAWSPDGKKIAFTSRRGDAWQIYVFNLATSELVQLTADKKDQARYPAWSPDGKQIVYSLFRGGEYQLWVMDADGSNQNRLVYRSNVASDTLPAWSPDGTFILFSRSNANLSSPASLMRFNIGIAQATQLKAADVPVLDVHFSPDGIWVAYETSDGNNPDIYLFNLLTNEKIRLTASPNVEFDPAWRP